MSIAINDSSCGSPSQAGGVTMYQQQRQSFGALGRGLQSNDLNAAQQAYASLIQNTPRGVIPPNSPLAQIGQALQSNDLASAQKAFTAIQAGRHGHHHHHENPQPDASPAGSPQTNTASTTGNRINVSG